MKNLHAKSFGLLASAGYLVSFAIAWLVFGMDRTKLVEVLLTAWKAVPIALGLWWLFDKWGWRYVPLKKWVIRVPDLNGTWEGTIKTTWKAAGAAEPLE